MWNNLISVELFLTFKYLLRWAKISVTSVYMLKPSVVIFLQVYASFKKGLLLKFFKVVILVLLTHITNTSVLLCQTV